LKNDNVMNMTSICIPLMERTVSEDVALLDRCRSLGADIVEIRMDRLKEGFIESEEISKFRKTGLKTILTMRPLWDGGDFKGTEEERFEILRRCIQNGPDLVDLELKMDDPRRKELLKIAAECGVGSVISYHDHEATPSIEDVLMKMELCRDAGGDIVKVVFTNNSIDDSLVLLKAGRRVKYQNDRYSIMGMGPFGHLSRIFAPIMGCEIVYASLDEPDIPGQLEINDLTEIWDVTGIGHAHGR
jgi:3-dehydroquinate dehydratase type I